MNQAPGIAGLMAALFSMAPALAQGQSQAASGPLAGFGWFAELADSCWGEFLAVEYARVR